MTPLIKKCKLCSIEFTVPRKVGRPPSFCSEEHRLLFYKETEKNRSSRKNQDAKYGRKTIKVLDDTIITIRPIDIMRKNGINHDERQLLKARRATIQNAKEKEERKIRRL